MKDLGQEAVDEMNRLLLNQQQLKMKLERMGDNQISELSKKLERLQERLNECEEALVEAYDDCYDEGFEPDLAKEYLKKWGVK